MVATISPLSGKNASYYTKSYYLNGQAEGEWLDTDAASKLRLASKGVKPVAFKRLLRGFHPSTREALVQNAGSQSRQLGWDVQFAVDKSFSVIYAMVPEARAGLEECLKQAVRSTISQVLEAEFLETRRGQGGTSREKVSSPVATFVHKTNRDNEIHLHCHAPIPNVGLRQDETWGTIVSWNLYDAKLALGKAFHAQFVEEVRSRLGIECVTDKHGLSRVKGFPRAVMQALSSPSRKIAETAEDDSSRAKEKAHLANRSTKKEVPFDVVEAECLKRAAELGLSVDDARRFLGKVQHVDYEGAIQGARELIHSVIEDLPQEFSKAELLEHAYRAAAKAGIQVGSLRMALAEAFDSQETIKPLGRIDGREQYRKFPEKEAKASSQFEQTREEEFRQFLGQVIAERPELNLAAFHAKFEHAAKIEDQPKLSEELVARSVEETISDLEKSYGAISDKASVRTTLEGVLKQDFAGEQAREKEQARERHPFASVSLDTTHPDLPEHSQVAERVKRLERDAKTESNPAEAKRRSFASDALERVREAYSRNRIESAICQTMREWTDTDSTFTRTQIEQALAKGHPKLADPKAEQAAMERVLSNPKQVVRLGRPESERETRYTTLEMFEVEERAILAAHQLGGRYGHSMSEKKVERLLKEPLTKVGVDVDLVKSYRDPIAKVFKGGDLVFLEADSGPSMHGLQQGIHQVLSGGKIQRGVDWALERKDVLWVAPTANATMELKRTVGVENVATLQHLLADLDKGIGDTIKHHGSMMVNAALGMPTWEAQQHVLTKKSTVVLDSATLADNRQVERLLHHAEKSGARVIMCTTHELPPTGPGGLVGRLAESRRGPQEIESGNRVGPGVPPREVIGSDTLDEAKQKLIDRWAKEAIKKPEEHSIVAVANDDVHELNTMAQAKRKEAGRLGFRSIEIRYKHDGEVIKERIYENDRVLLTAKLEKEMVTGVFGTVKHIDLISGTIKINLDLKEKMYLPWEIERNQSITFQYRNYRFFQRVEEGFRLGYAATVHRTQNVAVQGSNFCLIGGPDGAPSAVYAGLGLAREKTYFFGDNSGKSLEDMASQLGKKVTAHEVLSTCVAEKAAEQPRPEERERVQYGMRLSM